VSAPDEAPLHCPTLERAWSDPAFMAQLQAERAEWQRQTHAMLTEAQERYWQRRRAEKGLSA
jgi:hypothetical protein